MLLQNHLSVKDTFKVQDGPMDFHVSEYKMFIDMPSALQLMFKKLQLVKFSIMSWTTHDNYLEKEFKYPPLFPTTHLCEAGSTSYTSA